MRFKFFSLFIISIILSTSWLGCKDKKDSSDTVITESETIQDSLPRDFALFYDRFHTDSQYQMDHITFPLEGLPHASGDLDSLSTDRYFWQREEWKKHNHFNDPSGRFEHWYEVLDDKLVDHWLRIKGTDMVMHRRFAKLDDEWYLIYYAGLRPYQKE
jgi:hypothetical protein